VSLNSRLEEEAAAFREHCKEQRAELMARCRNFEDEGA
jgi:hypothetical protein